MAITIRQEQPSDYAAVEQLIREAFEQMPESDHEEHNLVARLRKSSSFVPQLALVAEDEENNKIVGYILLTEVEIISETRRVLSLAVAPLAVLPAYQNQGVGSILVQEAHARAKRLGYGSTVLLGAPKYYTRFGYRRASTFGIEIPFEAPEECVMAKELMAKSLRGVEGMVRYPSAFLE